MMANEIVEVLGMAEKLNHDYIDAEDFGIALIRFVNGSYGIIEDMTNIYPQTSKKHCIFLEKKSAVIMGRVDVDEKMREIMEKNMESTEIDNVCNRSKWAY